MLRVNVVVEGHTESSFVQNVLAAGYFWGRGIDLRAPIIGVPGHKGGRCNYARLKKDVLNLLRQDRKAYCTTLVDFYGLGKGFPGEEHHAASSQGMAAHLESAMAADIAAVFPDDPVGSRFVPYIQVHEFEALLFSHPTSLASVIGVPVAALQDIRNRFASPEDINDSKETAPSKRILSVCPGYNKVLQGELAAKVVGIEGMRDECPRFRAWTDHIASWG